MAPSLLAKKLNDAVRHHEAGRLREAESLYRQILADEPRQADALHLLGVLNGETGREEAAIKLINTAIAIRPGVAGQHNNLGNVLRQAGRLADAIDSYRIAIDLQPSYASAWNNLGNALSDDGQKEAAIDAYERSLQIAPDVAEVHSNLGIALREQGRLEEAIAAHRRAIALAPGSSEAFNNLGVALRDKGSRREALAAHQRAVELRPHSVSALSNLGAALRRCGRIDEAIKVLGRALQLDPNYADAHNNLGSAMIDWGDFASAVDCCRRALELRAGYADAHGNMAIALAYLGRVDESMEEAQLAVRFMPEQPLAHWNLAMLLLLVGDFYTGWREHEWRWKCHSMLKDRQFIQPRWNGETLDGQTVLLFAEQGFGDTLQFIRYAPLIAQCGGQAVVECQPELIRLFDGMPGIVQFVRAGDPLPKFDLQCPLMSLPFAVRQRRFVPPAIPYLKASGQTNNPSKWQIDIDAFNIGLVWAGDPSHQNDRARSIALLQLAPLDEVSGVQFHSLQKGPAATETRTPDPPLAVVDHAHQLTDFATTADLIAHLDLVIAVDTAVAHLSAAMGKPTWVILPFMPDWRWMLHRADSDWYPTLRIFRQSRPNDWTDVIRAVVNELKTNLAANPLRTMRVSSIVKSPREN